MIGPAHQRLGRASAPTRMAFGDFRVFFLVEEFLKRH